MRFRYWCVIVFLLGVIVGLCSCVIYIPNRQKMIKESLKEMQQLNNKK
jgi:hypothetical protein